VLVREYAGPVPSPVHPGDPRETADTIAFGPWGAGYGDADKNREVEMAAEAAVTQQYEATGWTIARVAHLKCGWDLTASRGAEERHLEVKGVSSSLPSILLTRNELGRAEQDTAWSLAVVTTALSDPTLLEFDRDAVIAASTGRPSSSGYGGTGRSTRRPADPVARCGGGPSPQSAPTSWGAW
jgi:hypothetical protein